VVLLAMGAPWSLATVGDKIQALLCLAGFLALSLTLGGLPMALAIRRVRTMEI
jgi:hypothetical protein